MFSFRMPFILTCLITYTMTLAFTRLSCKCTRPVLHILDGLRLLCGAHVLAALAGLAAAAAAGAARRVASRLAGPWLPPALPSADCARGLLFLFLLEIASLSERSPEWRAALSTGTQSFRRLDILKAML